MRTVVMIVATPLLLIACSEADMTNRVVGELASDRIELTAESAEPIFEIAIDEGSAVTAGQPLLRQNAERAQAKRVEAEAALAQAQARLDELLRGPRGEKIAAARANVTGAEQDLEFRATEYERAKQVYDRKLASPELLDRTQAALDAARSNLDLRRAQLEELLTGTTVEELAQAEQSVKQAEARLASAIVDVSRHEILAPVDGLVDSRLFEVGERPVPGKPVLILLPAAQPHARVFVPERLRVSVSPGSRARIFVDGLDTPIDGRVRWVASESAFTPYYALTERDRGRLSYVAKVDIVEQRDRLPDGVPVEVEFLLGSAEP